MIRLRVIGEPAPQGSKTAVVRGPKVIQLEGSSQTGRDKHRAWRRQVSRAASARSDEHGTTDGPCTVTFTFYMPRGKTVRRPRPSVKPDLDKLIRSTLDGLVDGGLLTDDALVVDVHASKHYADDEPPGAVIHLASATERAA